MILLLGPKAHYNSVVWSSRNKSKALLSLSYEQQAVCSFAASCWKEAGIRKSPGQVREGVLGGRGAGVP